ncbi:uncharacterized protein [Zea mays]|uniref:uncharacterized protein n=1 Tax=Zea mays TaxID=4577 RepID=UPI0009A96A5A|nr:uncharacterized protein LOC109944044 [Zea mays]|eukprot:XP_020404073.1 uncharacterized protein LOC109944044 [Zea mays]
MLTYPTPRQPPCPPSRSPGDRWSSLSRGLDVPNLTKRCGRFVSTTPCPRRFDLRLHIHREHEAGKTESSSSSPCTAVVAILRCFVSPTKSLCRRETCSCFAPPHPLLRTSVTQQPLPLQQRPCPSSVLARVWISSPHTLHLLSHAAVAPSTPTIAARRSALGLHDAPYTQWRGANFLATGEHNGHGGGRPSLRPAAGPRRKAANDTVSWSSDHRGTTRSSATRSPRCSRAPPIFDPKTLPRFQLPSPLLPMLPLESGFDLVCV